MSIDQVLGDDETETPEGAAQTDATDSESAASESAAGEPSDEQTDRPGGYQWAVVVGGTVLAIGGIVAAFAVGTLTLPSSLLLVVGLVALLLATWRGYTYSVTGVTVTEPPTVGLRAGVRRTGADLESTIRDAENGSKQQRGPARVALRRRLEPLAARLLASQQGCSTQEATERLRDGTWNDDDTVTRLFRQRRGENLLTRVLRWRSSVTGQVQAAMAALAAGPVDDPVPAELGPPDDDRATGPRWDSRSRQTGHWRGASAAGLATLAVAFLVGQPGLVLVSAILLGVAGFARLGTAPSPTLAVERTVDDEDPRPGEHVTVTVTVENAGDALLPDLRLVDAVPADLRVVGGSPHHATALRPGERATFEYDVLAVYGDHAFETLHTMCYDVSGHHERTGTTAAGSLRLSCEPAPVQESVPLHPQTSGVVGRVSTDVGGSGHEFHSVREYRRGDPLRRVDWNRVARTGDLATLQFREEHAATVVVLVDTRAAAFQAPDRDDLSAVDRSLAGTTQVVESLLADGDRVGLATVGLDWTYVSPGAGSDHRERVRQTLQSDPNFSGTHHEVRFAVDRYVRRLRRRLPSDAQLVVFSPLLDEKSAAVARRLHAHGHSVTAFSPDPTTTATLGGAVARIERSLALETLREAGIPVVDWHHDEPLALAVERAQRGVRG